MRIAIVNQPWALSAPPSESVAIWSAEVAARLSAAHDVAVYGQGGRLSGRTEEHDGVRYVLLPRGSDHRVRRTVEPLAKRLLPQRRPYFASPLFYPTFWWNAERALAAARPDVVHVHMFPQFVSMLRRRLPSATIALHLHWGWITLLDPLVMDRRLEAASLVLSCSDALTEAVRAAYPRHADRCHTIYNGVDVARFAAPSAAEKQEHGAEDDLRLLFIGRIAPDKGLHVLLEAFMRLLDRHPRLRLDIVGGRGTLVREMGLDLTDDPLIKSLEPFYAERDVDASYMRTLQGMLSPAAAERVRFVGRVPHAEIPARMAEADLLVNTAIEEAFGMPVVEAMAAGLPVVASRVGGLPEVVQEGVTGLLVPPADPGELAAALDRLLADPELRARFGAAGRRRVEDTFGWEHIAARAEALYERTARPARAPLARAGSA